jgi:hypothetical protein
MIDSTIPVTPAILQTLAIAAYDGDEAALDALRYIAVSGAPEGWLVSSHMIVARDEFGRIWLPTRDGAVAVPIPASRLSSMSLDGLSALEAEIAGERARRAGTGIEIRNGRDGDVADAPDGGAVLRVRWAVEEQSTDTWYPSSEAAEAALIALARAHGRVPSRNSDGRFAVDLTCNGCCTSNAWVEYWS